MIELVLSIIFSLLLLPMNVLCAHWLYKEAMHLTGMTYREYLKQKAADEKAEREEELTFTDEPPRYTDPEEIELSRKTSRMKSSQRHFLFFLHKYSADPKKSFRFIRINGYCTFLGLAALEVAQYTAVSQNPDKLKIALFFNILLFILNLGLLFIGNIYRKKHPLDEIAAEKLRAKREKEKAESGKHRVKHIIVYGTVGAVLFGTLLFFMLGMAGIVQQPNSYKEMTQNTPQLTVSQETMYQVLRDNGFETAEIPVTYWFYEENHLMHVCAGVKADIKFEFYDYNDGEPAENVYSKIIEEVAPDIEPAQLESYETVLTDSGKMFSGVFDGIFQLCLYREDTLIYAYCPMESPRSLDEINLILSEIGYLKAA